MKLKGKVAVVTGGSQGIGEAARAFPCNVSGKAAVDAMAAGTAGASGPVPDLADKSGNPGNGPVYGELTPASAASSFPARPARSTRLSPG